MAGHLGAFPQEEAVADGIDCLEHITTVFDFAIPPEARRVAGHRADPTADLRNARAIEAVVRGGRVCDPTRLLAAVPAK